MRSSSREFGAGFKFDVGFWCRILVRRCCSVRSCNLVRGCNSVQSLRSLFVECDFVAGIGSGGSDRRCGATYVGSPVSSFDVATGSNGPRSVLRMSACWIRCCLRRIRHCLVSVFGSVRRCGAAVVGLLVSVLNAEDSALLDLMFCSVRRCGAAVVGLLVSVLSAEDSALLDPMLGSIRRCGAAYVGVSISVLIARDSVLLELLLGSVRRCGVACVSLLVSMQIAEDTVLLGLVLDRVRRCGAAFVGFAGFGAAFAAVSRCGWRECGGEEAGVAVGLQCSEQRATTCKI